VTNRAEVLTSWPTTKGNREESMKTRYTVALAVLAGFGLGAVAVQGLHAQGAKPPIYFIAEVDVTNIDAYTKEYAPKAQALIKASGGRILAAGQKVTALEGEPPKPRVAVQVWESMEQIQAWRGSAEFKELRKIGEKYAKFRTFTVEGLPQ
jgi:uncharacterized protein (DUF1330 family)